MVNLNLSDHRMPKTIIPSGWEGEVISFKKQLRMPEKLINVSRPKDYVSPDEEDEQPPPAQTTLQIADEQPAKKPAHCNGKKLLGKSKSLLWRHRWNACAFRTCLLFTQQKRIEKKQRRKAKKAVVDEIKTNSKQPVFQLQRKTRKSRFRRRFRSGFDYLRKRKRTKASSSFKNPKTPVKAYHLFGSELDVESEIRSWSINKSLGESLLHRASRLGYLVSHSSIDYKDLNIIITRHFSFSMSVGRSHLSSGSP